jgi:hypothetical protein
MKITGGPHDLISRPAAIITIFSTYFTRQDRRLNVNDVQTIISHFEQGMRGHDVFTARNGVSHFLEELSRVHNSALSTIIGYAMIGPINRRPCQLKARQCRTNADEKPGC